MEISCNGILITQKEDAGTYSYMMLDNSLEVFFTYSEYGKDILVVGIPVDSNEDLQAGIYHFILKIPAKHMANKQNKALEAKLTVVDPSGVTHLTFTDDASYDLVSLKKGEEISPIDVSKGVLGGISPYSYQASGLPEGITIGTDTGIIRGSPTKEGEEGTATITVTDSKQATASITIAVGAVTGEVTFLIEYPEKAEESFPFILIHLKENKFLILLKENEDYRKTTEGILVNTENFSPFIVGWKEMSLEDDLREETKEQTKEQQEKEEPIASGKQPEAKEEMSPLWLLLSVIVILLIIASVAFLFVKQKREE